ncbi:MAG: SDR family NAD(P)-dependent oxidoreductase, partial [Faecalibacterium sp.]
MYEDEFELTFNLSGEEPQPEQAAQEPPVPPKPKAAGTCGGRTHPGDGAGKARSLRRSRKCRSLCSKSRRKHRHLRVQAAANGRCVLISGGDRGIGAAAARAFYAAGYRVAVLYHSNAKAAAELEKQLPGITAVQCDVASRASCELAFRTAEQALGRVDVLVSNAGIAQQKLFTDIT